MKVLCLAALAALTLSWAQTQLYPGYANPNVSLTWLFYNKMRWAGVYSATTTYNPQDVVTYGGYTWVSLSVSSLANTPGALSVFWSQMVAISITTGTPTAGQAACIKSAGPPVVVGYCSTVVGSTGACTCN
jgi:hypothetical protein